MKIESKIKKKPEKKVKKQQVSRSHKLTAQYFNCAGFQQVRQKKRADFSQMVI